MRNQIRLMMGQLVRLGKGEITIKALAESLNGSAEEALHFIAPASGLILQEVVFD
jgi:tRNA pseudouridine38-40 synthase